MKPDTKYNMRKVYLENRALMLEDFNNSLHQVANGKPSIEGKICGMNYLEFNIMNIFSCIQEQEEYALNCSYEYVDIQEEKQILDDMVREAKKVLGDCYNAFQLKIK
jgi:hypothetical protein